MGKVLITGISGNVGYPIYETLAAENEQVVGTVTNIGKSQGKFPKAELFEFDFLNPASFQAPLEGVDRVFLMRPPQIGNPEDLYPFIDELKKREIKLIVFLSLMGIEKNPFPPHYKIEKYIEASKISYCHVRPGFFMQNISGVHAVEIRTKNEIFIPAGKSRCSFIDARDIGIAIATIFKNYPKHINSAYTITGQESLDYYNIADIMSEALERKIVYARPSFLKFRKYMIRDRKLDKDMVNVMAMFYLLTRLGNSSKVYNDFEDITGAKPRTFKQFVKENREIWQNK